MAVDFRFGYMRRYAYPLAQAGTTDFHDRHAAIGQSHAGYDEIRKLANDFFVYRQRPIGGGVQAGAAAGGTAIQAKAERIQR